jgi:general secretion pathway protein K
MASPMTPREIVDVKASGFALISVLWLVALLTVIATGLTYNNRQYLMSVSGVIGGTQARYLADGAIQLVYANLRSRNASDRLLADGATIELTLPGGVAEVTVQDEYGKIDINSASSALLARFLYSLDLEPDYADALADAIADFRDEDDLKQLNGAEDEDYLEAGLAWESKDAAFTSLEELRQVFGMTEPVYEAMLPHVTIHSSKRGVNPEVASLQVLMAISDDSPESLAYYIEQRRENHWEGLPLPAKPQVHARYLLRSRGVVYTVKARGRTEAGTQSGSTTRIRVRRSRARAQITTLDWQPYALSEVTSDNARDNLTEGTEHGE